MKNPAVGHDGSITLEGPRNDVAFVLVHGFASGPPDLLGLAEGLARADFTCEIPVLAGHTPDAMDDDLDHSLWGNQIVESVGRLKETYPRVYLIGFSLGSVVALDVQQRSGADGVVAISAFFGPKSSRIFSALKAILNLMGVHDVPRRLQTTVGRSRRWISGPSRVSLKAADRVIAYGRSVREKLQVDVPVLFVHSIGDRVASYEEVATYSPRAKGSEMLTLTGLNHFVQLDIVPDSLANVILRFFRIDAKTHVDTELDSHDLEQANEESRHWASIVFQLIVGFFTVLGTLIFFSIEEVLQKSSTAPLFLSSYSLVISIYIQLAALYFFYLVRSDAYAKCVLEPQQTRTSGWATFRSNTYFSGATSTSMTRIIAVSVIALPMLASGGIIAVIVADYWESEILGNALYIIGVLFLVMMWVWALVAAIRLNIYTSRYLYGRAANPGGPPDLLVAIARLYRDTSPGISTQSLDAQMYEDEINTLRRGSSAN